MNSRLKSILTYLLILALLVLPGCSSAPQEASNTPSSPLTSKGLEFTLHPNNPYYIVTGIGKCTDKTIYIPAEFDGLPVKAIGKAAFAGCTSFTKVVVPQGVEFIGNSAFRKSSLESITLPNGLLTIGDNAFESSMLSDVQLPDSLEELGIESFSLCPIKEISIPGRVRYIPDNCFLWCSSLKNVTLQEGVEGINEGAFQQCNITQITIPKSVTRIDYGAFFMSSVKQIDYYGTIDLSFLKESLGCTINYHR